MLSSTTATTKENIFPKRRRHSFTKVQLNKLEASFNKNDGYLNPTTTQDLVEELDLDEAHVKIWFQNRRAKVKRQTKPTTSSFAHPTKRSEIRDDVAQSPYTPVHGGLPDEITYEMLPSKTATTIENTYPRRHRHNLTKAQLSKLETTFNKSDGYLDHATTDNLARELDMDEAKVRIWFQNRRAKVRRQTKPTTSSLAHPTKRSEIRDAVDGRSGKNCKGSASDVNVTGLLGKPKLVKVSKQISVEAPKTGTADKEVSSPLMVYSVQTFSPAAVPRVLPVKENPRDHYDSSHVKKGQGQGRPQDCEGCSNVLSSNGRLSSHSGNTGMCLPHVPISTQLISKSVVDRTQETVVPHQDTPVHKGLPGEITFEPKEHERLNNSSRQAPSSLGRSLNTDDTHIQHRARDKVSFFSAMCEIDTDWTPLPDDVAVMFNSYRESPDCSEDVDVSESASAVVEKNVYLPKPPCS